MIYADDKCKGCDEDCHNGIILADCDSCSGTGEGSSEHTRCHECHGKGYIPVECTKEEDE